MPIEALSARYYILREAAAKLENLFLEQMKTSLISTSLAKSDGEFESEKVN